MSQPSQFELVLKAMGALWLALFWLVVTFVIGVIVWAIAGPKEAITVFVLAFGLFAALPLYLARRGRRR